MPAARIGPAVGPSDLGDVILVGHSRGGEGANRASAEIPLSAPYRISGQILIGPTDFGRQSAPYVPTVTMLPYCDGDVVDLQGQTFTDVARDYAPGDTALHSSLMVLGANHNFFNTEWTPGLSLAPSFDDWFSDGNGTCSYGTPSRLTKTEQRPSAVLHRRCRGSDGERGERRAPAVRRQPGEPRERGRH